MRRRPRHLRQARQSWASDDHQSSWSPAPITRSMPLSARPSPELAYVGEEEDGQHHNAPPSLPALSTTSSSPEPDFVASRRHSRHQSARVFPSGPSRRSMMGSAELGL